MAPLAWVLVKVSLSAFDGTRVQASELTTSTTFAL